MGFSAAAERNKGPILEVLGHVLPPRGLVLEVASGTGQHVVHFAAALPGSTWQPTEREADLLEEIDARVRAAELANVRPAAVLDARTVPMSIEAADAVVCINLLHISPWAATLGLMAGAAAALPPGGVLFVYGPFRIDGRHTSDGNVRFDTELRARDPAWGIRDTRDVCAAAADAGFVLERTVPMPANNLSLVFRKVA
jgi:SAM-dependent methyltransferase